MKFLHKIKMEKQNFTYSKYDIDKDDQAENVVEDDDRKFLEKDYIKNLPYAFIRFTPDIVFNERQKEVFKGMSIKEINNKIYNSLKLGEHYTNQTLSYTIKDVDSHRIWKLVIEPLYKNGLRVAVDATANIGGMTKLLALHGIRVEAWELQEEVYLMLKSNINLYHLNDLVKTHLGRYDYSVEKGCLVYIDPPHEKSFMSSKNDSSVNHFNLSIDKYPMYYIVERLLSSGAKYVLLNMPLCYKYNMEFAVKNNHLIKIYYLGNKNVKNFLITKGKFKPEYWKIIGTAKNVVVESDKYSELYKCKLVAL